MNYSELKSSLSTIYTPGEAKAIARMVMEERFGLSQTDLLLGKDSQLSADESDELIQIAQRLLKNEPVQYVLGYADFCGMRLRVQPGCLIPRPETEELIAAIDARHEGQRLGTALDIGTGSGCLALALARRGWDVTAWDVSEDALAIARSNAQSLGLSVLFQRRDILEEAVSSEATQYALIVSNPPYVRQSEALDMQRNVLDYEPHLALFVSDDDPLVFYRAIAQFSRAHLLPEGCLALEINQYLSEETEELFRSEGFSDVQMLLDAYSHPRIILARR